MEWWGPTNKLEFDDQPDALTIRATSIRRAVDLLWPSGMAIAFVIARRFGGDWLTELALGGVSAFLFFKWFVTSTTELRVTEKDIQVPYSGRLRWLDWSEIAGLEYRVGGEGESSGLYARKSRWEAVCLTSQLDESDCGQVIDAIYRRFPFVKMADDNSGGFRRDPEIISLGLNRKDP